MKWKRIKPMIASIMAAVMFAGSPPVYAAHGKQVDEEQIRDTVKQAAEQMKFISFAGKTEQMADDWSKPKALPAVIEDGKESQGRILSHAVKSGATVKTAKAFYKLLHDNLTARKKSFTIVYKGKYTDIYKNNVEKMFAKAWNQDDKSTSDDFDYLYPNINTYGFYISSYSSTKSVFQFKITYRESAAQLKKVNRKVKSALKSLKLSKLSNKEKVKKIHDYIINQLSYDRTLTRFTAYSGLVDSKHTTVCQGYAVLMYKMLTDAGVPCRYVTGYAGGPHAWNIVKLNGKWYHIDATWDDPVSLTPQLSYEYFLIGSKKIAVDHVLDSDYKTASFKKKYPISSKNYTWKDTSTKPTDKVDEVVEKKQEFCKQLMEVLDETLQYDKASELDQKLYDVYKEIIGGVFTDMPDDVFLKMYDEGDPDNVMKFVILSANDKVDEKIITPLDSYAQSDEFEQACIDAIMADYTAKQWNKLSKKQQEEILEQYMTVVFSSKLQSVSQKNSENIISEILKELKER